MPSSLNVFAELLKSMSQFVRSAIQLPIGQLLGRLGQTRASQIQGYGIGRPFDLLFE